MTTGDRRSQILEAATTLITEGGWGAVSVRAVAARAGIGASTMRYYFPSQEALTAALAERLLTRQLSDERIADASVPAADRLLECMAQFLPGDDDRHDAAALGWLAMVAGAAGPQATPLGRAMYAGMTSAGRQRVQAWLRATGVGDPPYAASVLLTRVDGLMLALLDPAAPLDLGTARAILRDDIDRLLDPRPRRAPISGP